MTGGRGRTRLSERSSACRSTGGAVPTRPRRGCSPLFDVAGVPGGLANHRDYPPAGGGSRSARFCAEQQCQVVIPTKMNPRPTVGPAIGELRDARARTASSVCWLPSSLADSFTLPAGFEPSTRFGVVTDSRWVGRLTRPGTPPAAPRHAARPAVPGRRSASILPRCPRGRTGWDRSRTHRPAPRRRRATGRD